MNRVNFIDTKCDFALKMGFYLFSLVFFAVVVETRTVRRKERTNQFLQFRFELFRYTVNYLSISLPRAAFSI